MNILERYLLFLKIGQEKEEKRKQPSCYVITTRCMISNFSPTLNCVKNFLEGTMPDNALEVHKTFLPCFTRILIHLDLKINSKLYAIIKLHTIGSQPTSRPPPAPFEFRMLLGRLAIRATTGYPFTVPNEDKRVLSAYMIINNGEA